MKKSIAVIICLFFKCLSTTAIAQHASPKPFKNLTVEDGLPQSVITGLQQDSTGFIWVGTRDGLARYDGRKFKVFRHVPGDSSTLSNNIIMKIAPDKKSRLWIEYENGDMDILNTYTEKLLHFTKDSFYSKVYKPFTTNSVAWDNSGNVFLVSSSGIYIVNIDNHYIHFHSNAAIGLTNVVLGSASGKNNVMLLTSTAFVRLDKNAHIADRIPYTFSNPNIDYGWRNLIALVEQNGEVILNALNRLIIYQPVSKSFTVIQLPAESLLNKWVVQDKAGNVYFDNDQSIYMLNQEHQLYLWRSKERNPKWGFASMLLDRSGVLWLGTNGEGIQLFDLKLPRLASMRYEKTFSEDVLEQQLHVPAAEIEKSFLNKMFPYYFRWASDKTGKTWIAEAGMATNIPHVLYCKNSQLIHPRWHYTDTGSTHSDISALALSASGKLWGIDYYMHPVYFDIATKAVTEYKQIAKVNFDNGFTASNLLIEDEDKFWITTALNGLFFYNRTTGQTVHYTYRETKGALPTNQLMNMVHDKFNPDIFWIGSLGGGLIKFSKSSGRCVFYTERDGLPNNTVYAVVADKRGILWCSSNKGIFSFDTKANSVIQSFTSKDGLISDEFNRYHFFQFDDERIAFGGIDGYTVFNPLNLSKDDFQPTVALTGIQINNVASDFGHQGSPLKQSVNSLTKIKLNYEQNFLTISFAALQYNITEKLQYRYMLEGIDKSWIYAGNNSEAVYTKLPPGDYTLKVNATNTAGEWSSSVKKLAITITPPFWLTWWFITLMAVICAAAAYLFIRSRIASITKQERQKIKFEYEASQLKAQALRAQMNPHFVFNCLNSIKALIQEDKKREAVIYLTTFSKLIRSQLNNAEQEVSLKDELETCKLYVQLEALRFDNKIVTEFKVDENIDISSLKVPPLLLQPFIENAIWHGVLPKESGKVTVSIVRENGTINCLIDDDGIGREMAMHNKVKTSSTYESKGMRLVQNRLTMYNNMSANKASVDIIDKKENDKPAGTLVIIKFKQEA